MKKLLFVLLLVIPFISIDAYENDYFSIDIPDKYELIESEDNIYKWTNNNSYIAVTVSSNLKTKYDVNKYTSEDLENQKEHMTNKYNESLKEYNVNVEVSDIKRIKLKDADTLEYYIYWPTKKSTGYNMYQKELLFTTKKYIVTLIYSSDSEILSDNETYNNLINSFNIKDTYFTDNTKKYLLTIVIIGTILGIFGYIFEHKKRKK